MSGAIAAIQPRLVLYGDGELALDGVVVSDLRVPFARWRAVNNDRPWAGPTRRNGASEHTLDMDAVIEDIRKRELHRALLRLWLALREDHPRLQRAESLRSSESGTHRGVKDMLGDILVSGNHLKLMDLDQRHELAFLQALDEFLWLCSDATGPTPPVRLELDGCAWFLHRRVTAASGKARHTAQSGHLQSWCRYHWVLPDKVGGFQVTLVQAPDSLSSKLEAALGKHQLRMAIASFADAVTPAWEECQPPIWRATTLKDEARRWENVRATLDQAFHEGAQIVVLPELTVTPTLVNTVRKWLDDRPIPPFLALVPGSFHQFMDGGLCNYAELLDGYGHTLIAHRKLKPYGTPEKKEGIVTGDRIELLDTPAGLMAMPICLDFCEEGHPFTELWQSLGVEWLLVPAFGCDTSVSAHLRRAAELQRAHGAVCALANQHPDGQEGALGFIRHDGRPEPEREVDGFLCVSVSIARLLKRT